MPVENLWFETKNLTKRKAFTTRQGLSYHCNERISYQCDSKVYAFNSTFHKMISPTQPQYIVKLARKQWG